MNILKKVFSWLSIVDRLMGKIAEMESECEYIASLLDDFCTHDVDDYPPTLDVDYPVLLYFRHTDGIDKATIIYQSEYESAILGQYNDSALGWRFIPKWNFNMWEGDVDE